MPFSNLSFFVIIYSFALYGKTAVQVYHNKCLLMFKGLFFPVLYQICAIAVKAPIIRTLLAYGDFPFDYFLCRSSLLSNQTVSLQFFPVNTLLTYSAIIIIGVQLVGCIPAFKVSLRLLSQNTFAGNSLQVFGAGSHICSS